MRKPGKSFPVGLLPAGFLLAGLAATLCLLPALPAPLRDLTGTGQLAKLLPIALLLIPVCIGYLMTMLCERFLLFPWLWLLAVLLLNHRPAGGFVSPLLSIAIEITVLLIVSVAELRLHELHDRLPGQLQRLLWPGLGICVTGLAQLPLVPDNLPWQRVMSGVIMLAICCRILLEALPTLPALNSRVSHAGGELRAMLQRLAELRSGPQPRRRLRSQSRPGKAPAADESAPSQERPMLHLGEGYLIRRDEETDRAKSRRRSG